MKWNWGTKLALAMAVFMVMIIVFVILMMRESVDLVEKDYYPKGQAYEEMIAKKSNTAPYTDEITLVVTAQQAQLRFPAFFDPARMSGTVHLYNRVEASADKMFELKTNAEGLFIFPVEGMNGRFLAKIDWEFEGKKYYVEKSLDLN